MEYEIRGTPTLVGVVSWATGCALPEYPGNLVIFLKDTINLLILLFLLFSF